MQPVNGRRYSSWPSKNNPGTPPLCWRTPDLKVGANSITRDGKSHLWAKDRCWTQREAAATLFVFHLFWSDCAHIRARNERACFGFTPPVYPIPTPPSTLPPH